MEDTDVVGLVDLGDAADLTRGGDGSGSEDKRKEYA
ncbi:MAG: albusnodin family lasso peptide [Actinomycetota bacterium]|nr:albusnodin family lasso peptide [Actinomycetota bacterium]